MLLIVAGLADGVRGRLERLLGRLRGDADLDPGGRRRRAGSRYTKLQK